MTEPIVEVVPANRLGDGAATRVVIVTADGWDGFAAALVRGLTVVTESLQNATRAIAEVFAKRMAIPDVTEVLDELELLDDAPDWREARSRAALRRRDPAPELVDQVLVRVALRRLAFRREPRRGPGRSRALLGRAHPLNRTERKGPPWPRIAISKTR